MARGNFFGGGTPTPKQTQTADIQAKVRVGGAGFLDPVGFWCMWPGPQADSVVRQKIGCHMEFRLWSFRFWLEAGAAMSFLPKWFSKTAGGCM